MNRLHAALIGIALSLLVGCQSLNVSTQHDPYVALDSYRRFDWLPEDPSQLSAEQQLLNQQLKYTLEQALLQKGIVRDSEQPDFLVRYYGSSQQKTTQRVVEHTNVWGDRDRYRPYHRDRDDKSLSRSDYKFPRHASSIETRSIETQTINYTEGTLVIDFLAADKENLVWQATIQGVLSRTDPQKSISDAVGKALEQFPPQSE